MYLIRSFINGKWVTTKEAVVREGKMVWINKEFTASEATQYRNDSFSNGFPMSIDMVIRPASFGV